tara:strand:+ start:49 stop:399 length:351 start_codon:yes stop_codon:yes gene_type:complete
MLKDKNIYSVFIQPSTRKINKYMVIFYNKDKKKIKTIHFGAKGYRDFTLINNKNSEFYIDDAEKREEVKKLYIVRHQRRENWALPDNAGSLSRWVLWNKPDINNSFLDYKKRFNLK